MSPIPMAPRVQRDTWVAKPNGTASHAPLRSPPLRLAPDTAMHRASRVSLPLRFPKRPLHANMHKSTHSLRLPCFRAAALLHSRARTRFLAQVRTEICFALADRPYWCQEATLMTLVQHAACGDAAAKVFFIVATRTHGFREGPLCSLISDTTFLSPIAQEPGVTTGCCPQKFLCLAHPMGSMKMPVALKLLFSILSFAAALTALPLELPSLHERLLSFFSCLQGHRRAWVWLPNGSPLACAVPCEASFGFAEDCGICATPVL